MTNITGQSIKHTTSKTFLISFFQCAFILLIIKQTNTLYSSGCDSQSTTRKCPQGDNVTEYLLTTKKGGTDILSGEDYNADFFTCEQYTYDCGYVQTEDEMLSIANGIQLDMTADKLDQLLLNDASLADKIKPYLNLSSVEATCGQKIFPLILTPDESTLFFTNYMGDLVFKIQNQYNSQKLWNSPYWKGININIKTAVSQAIKQDLELMKNQFWDYFLVNKYTEMSKILKQSYNQTNKLYLLHCAYLIDSVTQKCRKHQSVNFLVDQSGSITEEKFKLAKKFLISYFEQTSDDTSMSSVHFYNRTFNFLSGYGKTKEQIIQNIQSKTYGKDGTQTGIAIQAAVKLIEKQKFQNGIPKILIVLTDGQSNSPVITASNQARKKGVILLAIGIGNNLNESQLVDIAETKSNIIRVDSYDDLDKLVDFISNYFCKQIINIELNQTIVGNVALEVDSPAYFRVAKDKNGALYQLNIDYQQNPDQAQERVYTSQYDPFPDVFSDFVITEVYRPSITQKVYFIQPLQTAPIRIKKDLYENRTVTNSYVSVGGTNLRFNISLVPCQTDLCIEERKQISQKSQKLQKDRREFGTKANDSPADGKDYNIYAIIIGSFIGLICSVIIGIGALKKICGQEDQMLEDLGERIQPEATQQDISIVEQQNTQSASSQKSEEKAKSNN